MSSVHYPDAAGLIVRTTSTLGRAGTSEADYFRNRARAHLALAERSPPQIAEVHRTFAAAYGAAAAKVECGEPADFDGSHRAAPFSHAN